MTSFYSNGNDNIRQQEKADSIEGFKTVLQNLSDHNNEGECGLSVFIRHCEEKYGWNRRKTLVLMKRSLRHLQQRQECDHQITTHDGSPATTCLYQCHGGRGPRRGPQRSGHSPRHHSSAMEIEVTDDTTQTERELCMLVEEECVL